MERVTCICGGRLGVADKRGIRLCVDCCGTTDSDGLYMADPRSTPTMMPLIRPTAPPTPQPIYITIDCELLARSYLQAMHALQPLYVARDRREDTPEYDDLTPEHQNLIRAALEQAIREALPKTARLG